MAVINGTAASETLSGTAAADTITGAGGNDKALMGGGTDVFIWNPNDGNDTVDGGAGNDTIRFTGANVPGSFDIGASSAGASASPASSTTSWTWMRGTHRLQVLGGADTIRIDDFTFTDLKQVAIDLSNGTPGSAMAQSTKSRLKPATATTRSPLPRSADYLSHRAADRRSPSPPPRSTTTIFEIRSFGGNDKISAATLK